ncbi:hypothetical protein H6G91_39530, partial [Nostoc muscorum FACHB-395]|nr:hypothetical protein [Desmonostoc muscorum FACHB-395]
MLNKLRGFILQIIEVLLLVSNLNAEAIALSSDGHTLVGGGGKSFSVWHLPSQQPQLTLKGDANDIYDLALSADGQTLVSGSLGKTIKVWNLATG